MIVTLVGILMIFSIIVIFWLYNKPFWTTTTEQPDKTIALTFDDGPYGTSTEKILDILKSEGIHATFFLIGKNVEKFPALAREIIADGNVIGNHSYDHSKNLSSLTTNDFEQNLENSEQAIFANTGLKPKLFRPPYGRTSTNMLFLLKADGYTNVMWNIEARDWDFYNSSAQNIFQTIVSQARPNAIILLHDGRDVLINYPRDNTVQALPKIIESLKKQGYTFVTVDKILNKKPYW